MNTNYDNTKLKTRFAFAILKTFKANIGLIIGLVVLSIIVSIRSPFFFTYHNMMNVFRQISTNLFVASATTIILITGSIGSTSSW